MAVLERLGLAERADRFPDDLSGGERQRVAIARAVVGERHLLLADEPSGALDSANGEAVMRLVRETCQGGVAGVVVTHDAQLASWADRVIFLRDGRIVDQTRRHRRIRSRCWTRTRRDDHHTRPAPAPDRRAASGQRWRARPPRDPPLGLAAAAPRVAPAGAGAGAAHRRRRGHDGRARPRRQRAGHRSGRLRHRRRAGGHRRSRARPASPQTWPPPGTSSAPSRRSPTRPCRCRGRSPRSTCAPRIRTGRSAGRCCGWSPGSYPVGARRGGRDRERSRRRSA